MKKIITLLMVMSLCVFTVACGSQSSSNNTTENNNAGQAEENEVAGEQTDTTSADGATLVVYFSNTGNTKAVAEHIASGLDADIYEIVPEDPYTDADLYYNDNNSRSTQEMNDPSVRPVISGSVENMDQYDTIYIGYPIWWGEAPRIMNTFVESYDFTDKTVILFCTSSSSSMGLSATALEEFAGSGTWLEGQRFSENESESEVMEWINSL